MSPQCWATAFPKLNGLKRRLSRLSSCNGHGTETSPELPKARWATRLDPQLLCFSFLCLEQQERAMSEHVYKVVELVRSSTSSIEDAIQTAIKAGRPDFAQPALV
jgi:hypothetical protein